MEKQMKNLSILNIIDVFNSVSKCFGFSVLKPNDSLFSKLLREIIFLLLFSFSVDIAYKVEMWCITVAIIQPSVRKMILFVITQTTVLSPICCLILFRLSDSTIWKIVLSVESLGGNLIVCNTYLHISRILWVGSFFWFLQFFNVMSMVYGTLWLLLPPDPLLTFLRILYYEAWTLIPFLQFVGWISFLSYVLRRVQLQIIEIHQLAYLASFNLSITQERVSNVTWKDDEIHRVIQIRRFVDVMKQVLNISKKLSAVYGTTVFIIILQNTSRIIIQFYDIIDKDSQYASLWIFLWIVMARLVTLLPVFICCEQFSFNVKKTIELIQEIVMLYQPSRLDCIFESLALRLKHQSPTIQICGFLNITYRGFLAIITTATAFLVLQLQF